MGMVVKSEKVFKLGGENPFVGPGSYENLLKKGLFKANRDKQNTAPFNQSDLKYKLEDISTPGPGDYQVLLSRN